VAGLNPLIGSGANGAGNGGWVPIKHNGITYLCQQQWPTLQVLRVDSTNWRLIPVVKGFRGTDVGGYQWAYLWTDANGDGQEDPGERVTYTGHCYWDLIMPHIASDFTHYYFYGRRVIKHDAVSWNKVGGQDWAPVLRPMDRVSDTTFAGIPSYITAGTSNIGRGSIQMTTAPDGSIFACFNIDMYGWGGANDVRVVKWDANGSFLWEAGKLGANHNYADSNHTVNPGEVWSSFRNTVGVVHGCVIAADMNGGNANRSDWSAFEYCWDQDGLWVGNPFETANCDTSGGVPMTRYCLSSENGSGTVLEDPATGGVYYYGGQESMVRIYKITGWDNWVRQSGTVGSGAPCAAPVFAPPAGTYGSAQSVTITTATAGAAIRYTTNGTTPSDTVGTVYTGSVSISVNTTLKAIAYKAGQSNSPVTTGTYTIQCAAPTFSPAAGTYNSSRSVTITTSTSGASIRYTINGATPTPTYGTVYSGAIDISSNSTLKAIAYKAGLSSSGVTTGTYIINCLPPIYSPPGGTYSEPQSVTITTVTNGASIRYTADGSTPTPTHGTVYSGPIGVSSNSTLKAVAYKTGLGNSGVTSGTYAIKCAAPFFTPAPGTFGSPQYVTIATATADAGIRYTNDGTEPSDTVGTIYSLPVIISANTALKAIAFKTGMANSDVTTGTYSIVDLPGDVNGDCLVNILHLVAIRNRVGHDPAISDNARADQNKDGKINILDLIVVRSKLNSSCPQAVYAVVLVDLKG